jgi:hypothetical protein
LKEKKAPVSSLHDPRTAPILLGMVIDLAEDAAIGWKGSQDLEIFEMEGGEIEVGEKHGYCKLGF